MPVSDDAISFEPSRPDVVRRGPAGCNVPFGAGRCSDAGTGYGARALHPTLRALPTEPDPRGLRHDTQYFLGYQFLVIGLLFVMPEGISGWSSEQKEERHVDKWWENVKSPAWDKDRHYINYIGHPYWGATYYVRASERGYGPAGAFWYSVLLSSLFEFGAEAIFEPPSIQDLVVTPVAGSLVGVHFVQWREQTRSRMLARGQVSLRDRAVMAFTDPLGTVNRLVGRRFGRDVDAALIPYVGLVPATLRGPEPALAPSVAGMAAGAPVPGGRSIGVRLELTW